MSQPIPSTEEAAQSTHRRRRWWLWTLILLCLVGGPSGYLLARNATGTADAPLTWTAATTDLRITVTERGTLESQKTVNGVCEIEGYDNKIIFIVEEGSTVKEGDVVVRFDSAQIDKEIALQLAAGR